MENKREHFRHILYYYYLKGKKASEAHRKLCAVYGNKALKERQCQNWFAKFRSGISPNQDAQRTTQIMVNDEQFKAIINRYRFRTTCDIAGKLGVSHGSVEKRLKQLGYKKKFGFWVSPKLKQN